MQDHNERIANLEAAVADLQAKAGIAPAPPVPTTESETNVGITSTESTPVS
jgi:hypothetical protein